MCFRQFRTALHISYAKKDLILFSTPFSFSTCEVCFIIGSGESYIVYARLKMLNLDDFIVPYFFSSLWQMLPLAGRVNANSDLISQKEEDRLEEQKYNFNEEQMRKFPSLRQLLWLETSVNHYNCFTSVLFSLVNSNDKGELQKQIIEQLVRKMPMYTFISHNEYFTEAFSNRLMEKYPRILYDIFLKNRDFFKQVLADEKHPINVFNILDSIKATTNRYKIDACIKTVLDFLEKSSHKLISCLLQEFFSIESLNITTSCHLYHMIILLLEKCPGDILSVNYKSNEDELYSLSPLSFFDGFSVPNSHLISLLGVYHQCFLLFKSILKGPNYEKCILLHNFVKSGRICIDAFMICMTIKNSCSSLFNIIADIEKYGNISLLLCTTLFCCTTAEDLPSVIEFIRNKKTDIISLFRKVSLHLRGSGFSTILDQRIYQLSSVLTPYYFLTNSTVDCEKLFFFYLNKMEGDEPIFYSFIYLYNELICKDIAHLIRTVLKVSAFSDHIKKQYYIRLLSKHINIEALIGLINNTAPDEYIAILDLFSHKNFTSSESKRLKGSIQSKIFDNVSFILSAITNETYSSYIHLSFLASTLSKLTEEQHNILFESVGRLTCQSIRYFFKFIMMFSVKTNPIQFMTRYKESFDLFFRKLSQILSRDLDNNYVSLLAIFWRNLYYTDSNLLESASSITVFDFILEKLILYSMEGRCSHVINNAMISLIENNTNALIQNKLLLKIKEHSYHKNNNVVLYKSYLESPKIFEKQFSRSDLDHNNKMMDLSIIWGYEGWIKYFSNHFCVYIE